MDHVEVCIQMCFLGREKKCAPNLYKCGSGECLEPRLVCDGVTNCADRSDEGAGCAQRNCSSSSAPRCDHHCVSTPNGPVSAAGYNSVVCLIIPGSSAHFLLNVSLLQKNVNPSRNTKYD